MKKWIVISLIIIIVSTSAFAEVGFRGRPITNNLMMPTGYTMNQNEFMVGIGPVGFGISDNIQISTNVLLFLFQVYNANLKISLAKSRTFALAAGVEYNHFNWDLVVDSDNGDGEGDIGFTAISPYVSVSPKIGEKTTLHVAGIYSIFTGDADIEDVEITSTSSGTRIYAGLEHSISNRSKFLAETGYDVEFSGLLVGGGFLWGWSKFRLKLGVTYYKPKDAESGFTLPNIGLWWRFNA
jgi:hypothetical protein